MVSKNNQQWKQQQEARRVPHYGIRKLSIGVASVLLGTVFYMQSGAAYADVNPAVNAGNDSVKVVNKDSGTSGAIGTSSMSTSVGLASSMVLTGNTTNSTTPRQASGSSAEDVTKQVSNADSEPGSAVSTSQVDAGTDKTNAPVPNRQTSVAGNPSNERLSDNLSLSVNQNSNFNFSSLLASKVALTGSNNAVNGGFDKATWGTLDVNAWKGSVQGDYYQLTDYTGDANHVIVPNEADFAKAGISTAGKQVGVTSDLMNTIFTSNPYGINDVTVAFSKTDNKMVKAIDSNWYNTWQSYAFFLRSTSLGKFDGTSLDVSNVTNMSYMFFGNHISDLSSLINWKTDNVTNMSNMFGSNGISDLSPLANWNVSNVTDMSNMFNGNQISDLSPLANWKVANVSDMSFMFFTNQISDLRPLANWKVANVSDMRFMFGNNQISDLSPLANWKVDQVTDMGSMFNGNSLIQTKNLLAKRVINFVYPDGYTGKKQDPVTQTVDLPQKVKVRLVTKDSKPSNNILDWVTKTETPQAPAPVYFKGYTVPEIKGLLEPDKTVIARQQADITKPINVTVTYKLVESDTNDAFALDSKNGLHEHANVNDNGGYDTDFWGTLDVSKFATVKNGDNLEITGYTGDASKVIIPNIADFEINNLDQGAKQVTVSSSVMRNLAKNATRIGLSKTNNQKVVASDAIWSHAFISGYAELNLMDLHNLDTTNITNMSSMFYGGRNLKVVGDLSQWNTANVTNMSQMFSQASALTNIGDLSQWNTANVTDMSGMFGNASALTNIGDLSQWNTVNVTGMSAMFSSASALTNIGDLSKWDVSNVTNMDAMFQQASSLTNIGNLNKWDTSNVTDMGWMFNGASKLVNIGDLSQWNTVNVINMRGMFQLVSSLTNIGDLDNWNTAKVNDMGWMFNEASSLTNIGDLSKWDVSNVTNMDAMFQQASSLTNIGDLDNWNTSKVTDMGWMFYQASSLTNIGDLSQWNTAKVVEMGAMFSNASALTNIGDLSKWNVSNVADMNCVFYQASALTNIGDLSKWDVSNVANMSDMFYYASALKQLNISNWDLTKLTNKGAFQYFVNGDPNLVVIANNIKLPTWYQNELSNSNDFWNNYLAVITNSEALLKASGSVDNVTVDNASTNRPVFYNSNGSDDVVAVLKQADQAYSKQYQSEHPGYVLNLAEDVDQTDPIALANAKFISVPREVQFTIAYYDLTGKLVNSTTSTHKVDDTVSISPVAPVNYVLANGQLSMDYLMRWGLNEADFLVEPKVTMTTQTKTVSRTIKVQTPDGQLNNVVQTVTFVRNSYLNQVTKQTTYSPWSFNGQYQFSGYQPKPVDGYTVDVIQAATVTPDSLNTTVNVAYHPIPVAYSVDYQLANGTVVKNVSVTPERDGTIHLTAPQGYRLLTNVTDAQVVRGSQKLAVLVVLDGQTYTVHDDLPNTVTEPLTKTVTRTVKIMMPNGHVRTVKQSVKFERTATVKADGTVTYSNWQAIGRAQFNKVFVAKRHGYHLVITDASGKALTGVDKIDHVTAEMSDEVVNVKYVKD